MSDTEPRQPVPPRNQDEPMLYCPVCSTRLAELQCKLAVLPAAHVHWFPGSLPGG